MWKCVFAIIFVVLSKCGLAMHCAAVLCCYAVTDVVLCSHVVMYYVLISFLKVVYCVPNICGNWDIVILCAVLLCCFVVVVSVIYYVLMLYLCAVNLQCCGKVLSFCHKGLIFL